MIRAILFDVDGTLVDSNECHVRAWLDAFAHFGIDAGADDIRGQIGKGGDQLKPVFMTPEDIEARGEEVDAWRSERFRAVHQPRVRAFPGVRSLFERLKADGRRIVIATSSSPEELEHSLAVANVADLVDATTSRGDVEHTKPAGDIFRAALAKVPDLTPRQARVVGDTPYDAIAAAKAGLDTIGLLCGGFSRADLEGAGCVAIARDPEELMARYAELFG
ncbi:MAG TPA: HAD family hydrolase [Salinarimonas sp.]|nr:HAD family hydrolase [Salinarimonas sp.]